MTSSAELSETEIQALNRIRLAYEDGEATYQELIDALISARRSGTMPTLADIHRLLHAIIPSICSIAVDIRSHGWAAKGENLVVGAALENIYDQIRILEGVKAWFVLADTAFETHKPKNKDKK